MMKKLSKILCVVLACFMSLGLFACDNTKTVTRDEIVKEKPEGFDKGYTYTKQNNAGLMQFYSSDEGLDAFLNEYMERHLRYSDKAIGDIKIGETSTVWKEWEAMSVMWMNTTAIGYSPKESVASFISNIYQDEFGYIWVDSGATTSLWGQGWEFPRPSHSGVGADGVYEPLKKGDSPNADGSDKATEDEAVSEYKNHTYFMNLSPYNRIVNNWISYGTDPTGQYERREYGGRPYTQTPEGAQGVLEPSGMSKTNAISVTAGSATLKSATFETINKQEDALFTEEETTIIHDLPNLPKGNYRVTKNFTLSGDHAGSGYYLGEEDTIGVIADVFHAPFLELNLRITDNNTIGSTDAIEDIEVYWLTSDENPKEYDNTHMVKYSEFAITQYGDTMPTSCRVIFPMYAHDHWGRSEGERNITGLRIVFKFNEKGLDGKILLDRVAPCYDNRQINNNGVLLAAAAEYFRFSQDKAWLEKNIDKLRAAMQFYFSYCGKPAGLASDSELITTERLVGHDGSTNGKPGHGIGDGYWDAISCPTVNLYTNIYYYKALKSMAYLEEMAAAHGIESENTVAVRPAYMTAKESYAETAESLQARMERFTEQFREYFWNEETGRFLLGYPKADDDKVQGGEVDDEVVDYGFTTFNEKCVELGLASEEQAKSIMDWINGERTVESDTANNSGRTKQIYQYEFAPRWNTVENLYQFWWHFLNTGSPRYPTKTYAWNRQVQNGGTSLQCAYYDVAAEKTQNGTDAAFAKVKKLQTWYEKVAAARGAKDGFYSAYYLGEGIALQGVKGAGLLGCDSEFVEASLLYAMVPYQFFGLTGTKANTLDITPALPADLDWWKMENLMFGGIMYDLSIGTDWVQINSISAENDYKVCVTLPKPEGDFTVRQHTTQLTAGTDYVVVGDTVVITAPFTNGRIQIVK